MKVTAEEVCALITEYFSDHSRPPKGDARGPNRHASSDRAALRDELAEDGEHANR